jgi:O-succinylbenzoate synthase
LCAAIPNLRSEQELRAGVTFDLQATPRGYSGHVTYRFAHRRYTLPFRAPVRTAHGIWTTREGFYIRLEDSEGRVGIAEIAPIPEFGPDSLGLTEDLLRSWAGRVTADQLAAIPGTLGCVRFALAAAMEDIAGPAASSATRPDYLTVAALLPAGRPVLAALRLKAEAGFRTFKWKVGATEAGDELVLLDDVLATLPAGGKLRLDANGAWERKQAERWLDRCADLPIEFVEQPVSASARGSDDLLLGLAADYPTPIALDESIAQTGDILRWLDLGWRGVFVIKPSLGADPSAMERLTRAQAAVVFSSALETVVGARGAPAGGGRFVGPPPAPGFDDFFLY